MISPPSGKLRVIVFNVGNGDHILLQFPNGQYGIIDFCYQGVLKQYEPPAVTYLRNLKEEHPDQPLSLAFLHLSHPDTDHIKGFIDSWEFLEKYELLPECLWIFGGVESSSLLDTIHDEVQKYVGQEVINEPRRKAEYAKRVIAKLQDLRQSPPTGMEVQSLLGLKQVTGLIRNAAKVYVMAPLDRQVDQFLE
ncbi:MAG: hypothetical protein AAF804_22095, partial [Bacteroidota bacterium]